MTIDYERESDQNDWKIDDVIYGRLLCAYKLQEMIIWWIVESWYTVNKSHIIMASWARVGGNIEANIGFYGIWAWICVHLVSLFHYLSWV